MCQEKKTEKPIEVCSAVCTAALCCSQTKLNQDLASTTRHVSSCRGVFYETLGFIEVVEVLVVFCFAGRWKCFVRGRAGSGRGVRRTATSAAAGTEPSSGGAAARRLAASPRALQREHG